MMIAKKIIREAKMVPILVDVLECPTIKNANINILNSALMISAKIINFKKNNAKILILSFIKQIPLYFEI